MDGADTSAGLNRPARSLDVATLDDARFGFHRKHPQRSARRVFYFTQMLAFSLIAAGLYWLFTHAPNTTFFALHIAALVLFSAAIAWRLAAASILTQVLWRIAEPTECPAYTVLCPLYRETSVVADLVAALERLDYPRDALDVMLLVEEDDHETLQAISRIVRLPHIEVVIIPPSTPRTKPKALNAGLALARGQYVAVYDAEDRPHPQQLRAALAAFEDGDRKLACVQAPLAIDNANAAWIAQQFAAEYAIQFNEILRLLSLLQLPLPLGGSSNHFRTDILRASGGWDPNNVSKDRAQNAMNSKRFSQRDFTHPIPVPFVRKCLIGKRKHVSSVNVRKNVRTFAA